MNTFNENSRMGNIFYEDVTNTNTINNTGEITDIAEMVISTTYSDTITTSSVKLNNFTTGVIPTSSNITFTNDVNGDYFTTDVAGVYLLSYSVSVNLDGVSGPGLFVQIMEDATILSASTGYHKDSGTGMCNNSIIRETGANTKYYLTIRTDSSSRGADIEYGTFHIMKLSNLP